MNYEKEVGELNQGTDAWKPEIGVHKVVVITEPEETVYHDDEKNKDTPQIKLGVQVDKKTHEWYVTKGKTTQSVYGQLMVLGKHHGQLSGVTFTLVVNELTEKNKTRKSYTIPEAVTIMQQTKQATTVNEEAVEDPNKDNTPPPPAATVPTTEPQKAVAA